MSGTVEEVTQNFFLSLFARTFTDEVRQELSVHIRLPSCLMDRLLDDDVQGRDFEVTHRLQHVR